MRVEDTRINDVLQKIEMKPEETNQCKELLQLVLESTKHTNLLFSDDQLFVLGNHLLGVIRRLKNHEVLPAYDSSLMDQVSTESKELSQQILQRYFGPKGRENDLMEVFLLAVHFEGAKLVG